MQRVACINVAVEASPPYLSQKNDVRKEVELLVFDPVT